MTDHGPDREDHDTLPLPFLYVTRPNPAGGERASDSPAAAGDRPAGDRPAGDRPAGDRPAVFGNAAAFEEDVELDPVCTLEFVLHSRRLNDHDDG